MKKIPSKYRIITICLDTEDKFHGYYSGPEENGALTTLKTETENIDQLFKTLKYEFYKNEKQIKQKIKNREGAIK